MRTNNFVNHLYDHFARTSILLQNAIVSLPRMYTRGHQTLREPCGEKSQTVCYF